MPTSKTKQKKTHINFWVVLKPLSSCSCRATDEKFHIPKVPPRWYQAKRWWWWKDPKTWGVPIINQHHILLLLFFWVNWLFLTHSFNPQSVLRPTNIRSLPPLIAAERAERIFWSNISLHHFGSPSRCTKISRPLGRMGWDHGRWDQVGAWEKSSSKSLDQHSSNETTSYHFHNCLLVGTLFGEFQ